MAQNCEEMRLILTRIYFTELEIISQNMSSCLYLMEPTFLRPLQLLRRRRVPGLHSFTAQCRSRS